MRVNFTLLAMNRHPELQLRDPQRAFTIVELVIVIAVLGILSAYAMMKGASLDELSLPSQAQKLASDIRHAQTLAYTSGNRMRLTITPGVNGTYGVTCVTGTMPCNSDFSVTLEKNVVLAGTPTTLDFTSLGQPSAGASYTLTSGSSTVTVAVAALTGLVTVLP